MFIKSLKIETADHRVIRDIKFHKGLNLIVDYTHGVDETLTGNNVGKTTVLQLIDICLGKDSSIVYKDPENKKTENAKVRDFLCDKGVRVTLTLVDDLDNTENEIEIVRDFKRFCTINGEKVASSKSLLEPILMKTIFPKVTVEKPTFRQMIAHNIRYEENRLTNTLKVLDKYTSNPVYETMYLYLFGCNVDEGEKRQILLDNIKKENTYKKRLEKNETKNGYEVQLNEICREIETLEQQKKSLNINPELEQDLNQLNEIKFKINQVGEHISALTLRCNIINETEAEYKQQKCDIDNNELALIYKQAEALIPDLQQSFSDLVEYHNQMLENKCAYLIQERPELENKIELERQSLNLLLEQEVALSNKVSRSDTLDDFNKIVDQLNDKYREKGVRETIIEQIRSVEDQIGEYESELAKINDELFSNEFENRVKLQLDKFNQIFTQISTEMYDEKYGVKYDIDKDKVYRFSMVGMNSSSGKKQGEISCFDIAYTKFADEEGIPCLHFLLNDKKELVHDNQLLKLAEIVKRENVQFVASILEDKLPMELRNEEDYILKLSQDDKLFRIEQLS